MPSRVFAAKQIILLRGSFSRRAASSSSSSSSRCWHRGYSAAAPSKHSSSFLSDTIPLRSNCWVTSRLQPQQPQRLWLSTGTNGDQETAKDAEEIKEPSTETHAESDLDGDKSEYTVPTTIHMPDMSEKDDLHNTIEEWFKLPGDIVKRNDVLCDITTPEFTFGMVTDDEEDAIMGDILVEAGEMCADNAPICIILHKPDPEEAEATDEADEPTK